MSAPAVRPGHVAHGRLAPARPADPAAPATVILIAAGMSALLLRPELAALPATSRVAALAGVSVALLAACLLATVVGDGPRLLHPATGLAIGLAAVAMATVVAGPMVPMPFVRWALPLSLLTAVAEEALFRRVAYGWLTRWGVPVAIAGSALLFALIHVPLYGIAVLPVDLGAGLLLGWQRWATGSWTVPAATHATANLIATVMR